MIFLDTNVISETLAPFPDLHVQNWIRRHERELAISTIVLAELVFGIEKIRSDQRAKRLGTGVAEWRRHLAGRIFDFTEAAADHYGVLMGAAKRRGISISSVDGMIAAIAAINNASLATRNIKDFRFSGVEVIDPWSDAAD